MIAKFIWNKKNPLIKKVLIKKTSSVREFQREREIEYLSGEEETKSDAEASNAE